MIDSEAPLGLGGALPTGVEDTAEPDGFWPLETGTDVVPVGLCSLDGGTDVVPVGAHGTVVFKVTTLPLTVVVTVWVV